MSRKLIVEIVGEVSPSLRRSFDETEKHANKTGGALSGLGKAAAFAAGGAGVALLVEGLKSSVEAASKAQQAQAKLDAAFKSSGVNIGRYSKGIEQARDAGRKLGFTNVDTESALSRLIVATHNGSKAIEDLGAAQDIARFKGISLEAASTELAKAMTGSQRAAKALGLEVQATTTNQDAAKLKYQEATDALKAQFPALNNLTQAQRDQYDQLKNNIDLQYQQDKQDAKIQDHQITGAKIIDQVSEKLHGQADAYSKTAAGGMAQFHAQLDNLNENIGQKIIPILSDLIGWVNKLFDFFQAHREQISQIWAKISVDLQQAWTQIKPILQNLMDLFLAVVTTIRDHWSQIEPIVNDVAKILKTAAKIMADALRVVTDLLQGDWSKAWRDARQLVFDALDQIKNELVLVKDTIGKAALDIGKAIFHGIVGGLEGLGSALVGALKAALNFVIDQWNSFTIHIGAIKDPIFHKTIFAGADIPLPNIPHLAAGGIVTGPTMALIGENGPEAVMPLGRMGGAVHVTVNGWVGNDQDIAQKVRTELLRIGQRNGTIFGQFA